MLLTLLSLLCDLSAAATPVALPVYPGGQPALDATSPRSLLIASLDKGSAGLVFDGVYSFDAHTFAAQTDAVPTLSTSPIVPANMNAIHNMAFGPDGNLWLVSRGNTGTVAELVRWDLNNHTLVGTVPAGCPDPVDVVFARDYYFVTCATFSSTGLNPIQILRFNISTHAFDGIIASPGNNTGVPRGDVVSGEVLGRCYVIRCR